MAMTVYGGQTSSMLRLSILIESEEVPMSKLTRSNKAQTKLSGMGDAFGCARFLVDACASGAKEKHIETRT